MLAKFIDKISEKIADGISKTHGKIKESLETNTKEIKDKFEQFKYTNPPPPKGVRKPCPPPSPPRPQSVSGMSTTVKDMDFPKELRTKEVTELPEYLKDVSKTIITIEEGEMEKVVKVVIDIGPNLANAIKEVASMSTTPGATVANAFGPFLLESAKNIVLVLKENSGNEKPK
jgi:gas vesicle protein